MKATVRVDLSEVFALGEAADAEMTSAPQFLEHTLRLEALEERRTHLYKNQTGHLEQGTKAGLLSQVDDEIIIHYEMGEPYASFVVKRGYSEFPESAKRAEDVILRDYMRAERKLARM